MCYPKQYLVLLHIPFLIVLCTRNNSLFQQKHPRQAQLFLIQLMLMTIILVFLPLCIGCFCFYCFRITFSSHRRPFSCYQSYIMTFFQCSSSKQPCYSLESAIRSSGSLSLKLIGWWRWYFRVVNNYYFHLGSITFIASLYISFLIHIISMFTINADSAS